MKETFTILNWNKSVKILKIIHSKQTLRQQFYFDVYEIQSKEKELRKQTNFCFDKKLEFVEIKKRYNGHLTLRYNYEHIRKKKRKKEIEIGQKLKRWRQLNTKGVQKY